MSRERTGPATERVLPEGAASPTPASPAVGSSDAPLATQPGWSKERIGPAVGRVWPEWFVQALPGQYPNLREPPVWLVIGGRGAGKTRLGAEWVNALARGLAPFARRRHGQIALVGETLADVREVMIDGPSGIRTVSRGARPRYEPTRRRLLWSSGAVAQVFSSEDPESLRGPQFEAAWLDELGCPAVDKGPNQPNVFPDPKSAENAIPHFSSGGRSDLAQHRFLAAHQAQWDPAAAGFEPAANPASDRYDGRMVDPGRIYLWAWDARPFPAFPLIGEAWRDGGNWATGHWLNGRLGGATAGDLVQAILADHGLPAADADRADGTLHGYVIADPRSARAALEPVADLFGLVASEDGGILRLASEAAVGEGLVADVLVADGETVFRAERTPDHHLPTEFAIAFHDPMRDYQARTARAVRLGAEGVRQETVAFPGAMEAGAARSLAEDRLRRLWAGRDTVAFDLPPAAVGAVPGRSVRLPGHAGDAEFLVEAVEQGLVRRVSARRIVRVVPTADVPEIPADKAAPAVFGTPAVQFLDLPMAPGGEAPERGLRIAAWAKPWRSQAIHASPEATGFVRRATAARAATVGALVEPLVPGVEGRVLRGATLVVRLNDGALSSVSRARLLNGANAAAVRSQTGAWEILQFENAEEIAASVWRLAGLLRGQSGTGDCAAAGAAAGAAFVLLDDAVVPAGLAASEIGLLLNWRVGPSGHDLSAAQYVEQDIAGGVRARMPLSPVHIRATRSAGGDWAISWIRRGRIDADSWDGADIPLGEREESYRIDIGPPGGPVLRSATAAETDWTYAAADLVADFGGLPAAAEVAVRQLGAGGWGLPGVAQITFN